eukprot:PhF_6_TR601/c0_g2_i1/m.714/K10798/PARP; poly [ADP-ribose] polymerase
MTSNNVGSPALRDLVRANPSNTSSGGSLHPSVAAVVDLLFKETWDALSRRCSYVPQATLPDVMKAHSILNSIFELLDPTASSDSTTQDAKTLKLQSLSKDFFQIIPGSGIIDTLNVAKSYEDVVYILQRMLSAGEQCVGQNLFSASVQAKAAALNCTLTYVEPTTYDRNPAVQSIIQTLQAPSIHFSNGSIKVVRVFEVDSAYERGSFDASVGNVAYLLHASSIGNFSSILTQGLRLPASNRIRRDMGMLGRGIYFGSCNDVVYRYCTKGSSNTAFVLVNKVALGNVYHSRGVQSSYVKAPQGFDSVHGVKSSVDAPTQFMDDEYVVYRAEQQRMAYLVEVEITGNQIATPPVGSLVSYNTLFDKNPAALSEKQPTLPPDPTAEGGPQYGIVGEDCQVALQRSNVQVSIVDTICETTLLLEYRNNSRDDCTEASFVFPLTDGAAVSAFTAYINDLKIIGVVKEKEKARQEYQEAVDAGKKAYLMEESREEPNVFTIRLGNIPALTNVIISITYVAELVIDSAFQNAITYRYKPLDRSKAPTPTDIIVGIDMPFDIISITTTYPHAMKMKRSMCRAVMKADNLMIASEDFIVRVVLSHQNIPRVWVEDHPTLKSRVAMITFFAHKELEEEEQRQKNVLLALDLSSSMNNGAALDALKESVLVTLNQLPSTWNVNVIAFGTTSYEFFPTFVPVTTARRNDGLYSFLREQTASYGMTRLGHLFQMLTKVYGSGEVGPVDVLLFSDGHFTPEELSQTKHSLQHSTDVSDEFRLFTVGCGVLVNEQSMTLLSRLGGGSYEGVSNRPTIPIQMQQQVARLGNPSLSRVHIEWSMEENDRLRRETNESVVQTPMVLGNLFQNEKVIVYGFVEHQARQAELVAGVDEGTRYLVTTHGLSFRKGTLIHRLATRRYVQEYVAGGGDGALVPEGVVTKPITTSECTRLSLLHGIVSPFTSMVAIEDKADNVRTQATTATPSIEEILRLYQSVDVLKEQSWQTPEALEEEYDTPTKNNNNNNNNTVEEFEPLIDH